MPAGAPSQRSAPSCSEKHRKRDTEKRSDSDAGERKRPERWISSQLNVAFDTTLVALLVGLVLNFFYHR